MPNKLTGPRTPQGKARSSQNAAKHQIFTGGILPGEEKIADSLRQSFQRELRLEDALEFEISDDLTLNRLKKRRIDEYEVHEFKMNRIRISTDRAEQHEVRQTKVWLRESDSIRGIPEPDWDRLPPEFCIQWLTNLKDAIVTRGLQPAAHLRVIKFVYGNGMTEFAAMIVNKLKALAEDQCEEGKANGHPTDPKDQELILETLDVEIENQKERLECERRYDEMEFGPEVPILPPDAALDRILKYRTANTRDFSRCLGNLEAIRRLKGKS